MLLVDTSVWIDHLRTNDETLVSQLKSRLVCLHPFVIGELACGNLKARAQVLSLLQTMQRISVPTDDEVLFFIEHHQLMGRGIGYVDTHLLAAVAMDGNTKLWTRDKRLQMIAEEIGLAHVEAKH